jgi:SSS family solute:Na+ symporter
MLFLFSAIVIVVMSMTSAAPDEHRIKGLTFSSLDRAAVRASWDIKDIVATVVVLGLVLTLYLYFSFWIG